MLQNEKEYQLWYLSDEGYKLKEFDTLDELFDYIPDVYTTYFYITKKVNIKITEN